jgi:hypothetical protein
MAYINWSNITGLEQIPAQANVVVPGFWTAMLYMIFIILVILTIFYGLETSLLISSFLCMILGIFLVYAGLMSWTYLMVFPAIILFMFMYITWQTGKTR